MSNPKTDPDKLILQFLSENAKLKEDVSEIELFGGIEKDLGDEAQSTFKKTMRWLEIEGFIDWMEGVSVKLIFAPKNITEGPVKP